VNSGYGFCWCRHLEPGDSARASSKGLAACLLLEPGGSARASSKRLAACLLLEPGNSVCASSKRLACLLRKPSSSVHAVSKSPAVFVHSHSISTALDACKTEQGSQLASVVYYIIEITLTKPCLSFVFLSSRLDAMLVTSHVHTHTYIISVVYI